MFGIYRFNHGGPVRNLIILIASIIGLIAQAAPTAIQSQKIQFQCKAKAKEIAQSTYTSCLNDAREAELDKVKQDYKEKLDKLKTYYDKKIKSLSTDETEAKAKNGTSDFPNIPQNTKTSKTNEPESEESTGDSETN